MSDFEYGFYDSEEPGTIFWYSLGVPFSSAGQAKRVGDKNVLGQTVVVRRKPGATKWENAVTDLNQPRVGDIYAEESSGEGHIIPNLSIAPYTPTTEEVREIYFESGYKTTPEQFDRWLAEVKAEANIELVARIEAAVILLGDGDITPTGRRMISKVLNPYRQGEEQ